MAFHVWFRSNIFTQHFALQTNAWLFSYLCQQGFYEQEKVTDQRPYFDDADMVIFQQ